MSETKIALSLGGNIGNVKNTFALAIEKLKIKGVKNIKISPLYRTDPVGCEAGTPDFINAAVTGLWGGTVNELFELCKTLEVEAGRPRDHVRYGSRTLDLDILFFGSLILSSEELTIPHIEASSRFFVLMPLNDIASEWDFPGKDNSVQGVLKQLSEKVKATGIDKI